MGVIRPNHNNDFLIWNEIGHLFPLKNTVESSLQTRELLFPNNGQQPVALLGETVWF